MSLLLAVALTFGSWQGTDYTVNNKVCGMVVQGTMQVTIGGDTYLPVYAVTFGKHKDPSKAWKTEAEAELEVEKEIEEDRR